MTQHIEEARKLVRAIRNPFFHEQHDVYLAAALAAAEERGRSEERERCARVMSDPCVQKLKDGEPFFVLLGRDAYASQALSTWITLRLRSEGRTPKVNAAEKTLDAFREFQDAITKEPTP